MTKGTRPHRPRPLRRTARVSRGATRPVRCGRTASGTSPGPPRSPPRVSRSSSSAADGMRPPQRATITSAMSSRSSRDRRYVRAAAAPAPRRPVRRRAGAPERLVRVREHVLGHVLARKRSAKSTRAASSRATRARRRSRPGQREAERDESEPPTREMTSTRRYLRGVGAGGRGADGHRGGSGRGVDVQSLASRRACERTVLGDARQPRTFRTLTHGWSWGSLRRLDGAPAATPRRPTRAARLQGSAARGREDLVDHERRAAARLVSARTGTRRARRASHLDARVSATRMMIGA
jgi:hypothetical protein